MTQEEKYLNQVEKAMDEQIQALQTESKQSQEKYQALQKQYTEAFYDEIDIEERSQYNQELADIKLHIDNCDLKQKRIAKQKSRPYFARIDFKQDGENTSQKIYIGFSRVAQEGQSLVYDWRAPICSMYYDYDVGKASYQAPDEVIKGEVTLKRQFGISNGKLEYYVDTDQNINDEILQQVLSKNASTKMKEIVSSIQKEQNAIIREEKYKTILVQGVAGSGKTSIALHRAGWLLYKRRGELTSDDILILSPSNLFSSYVSEVLPELGEDNVIETTFSHIAKTELKKQLVSREKLIDEIYKDKDQDKLNEIAYKSSFEFLDDLLDFLNNVYAKLFDPTDLKFEPKGAAENAYNAFVFSKEELKDLYYNAFGTLPVNKRIEYMVDYLSERFALNPQQTELIKPRFKNILYKFFPIDDIYKICNVFYARKGLKQPSFKDVAYEDIAPLLVIKEFTQGLKNQYAAKYVIIDEMQDFTPAHFYFFNSIWQCPKIVLGDINQCIEKTLSKKYLLQLARFLKAKTIVLNKTYRSTRQISEFSEHMIGLKNVVNFSREGSEPRIIKTSSTERALLKLLNENFGKFGHTAIVCKNSGEVKKIADMLNGKVKFEILVGADLTFDYPLVITTASTAKGIEFDHVIVPYATAENYHSSLDRNLLYVATTRALHQIEFIYEGRKSKFLKRHDYAKNDK